MAHLTCADALRTLLDQVDYMADPPACRVNEMVGAVLPTEVIALCREALANEPRTRSIAPGLGELPGASLHRSGFR
jgi:hypothetical protein